MSDRHRRPAPQTTWKPIRKLQDAFDNIKQQLARVIVGQDQVIEELLIALFSRGHCILEGVPGLAKTLMISHAGQVPVAGLQPHPVHARLDAVRHHRHRSHRGEPHRPATASSSSCQGPLFANVILADEINRTPPKTQAALLEAMQERQVTVGRRAAPARRPVLRAGHAEPDRAGRHLSAARSPAGPLHVQGVREVSELQRGVRDRPADDGAADRGDHAGADRRADPGAADSWCARCR